MLQLSHPLTICDIGAALHGDTPTWHEMVTAGFATVIGFEPDEQAYAALEKLGEGYEFLPHIIADGKPGRFHLNDFAETSSLLPTNRELVKNYVGLAGLMTTKRRADCETKTLDDALDGRQLDLLKVDVQGMTLPVLQNAEKTLSTYPVVECEVEFQQLYEGQALFAEVDQFMRSKGFMLLRFNPIMPIFFKPVGGLHQNDRRSGQAGWTDAIYVPNHDAIDSMDQAALERLVALTLIWYSSIDFACFVMHQMDRRFGTDRLTKFGEAMNSTAPLQLMIGENALTLPNFWNHIAGVQVPNQ